MNLGMGCSCEEKLRNMKSVVGIYCLPKSEITNKCDLLQIPQGVSSELPGVIKSQCLSQCHLSSCLHTKAFRRLESHSVFQGASD